MIAGVCAAFALQNGWDLALVRLVFVLATLFTGVPVVAYLIAWLVIPNAQYALPAQASPGNPAPGYAAVPAYPATGVSPAAGYAPVASPGQTIGHAGDGPGSIVS